MKRMFKWEESVEIEWDNQASTWDERSINMWDHGSRKDIIPFFATHAKKGAKTIDVGCGSGYSTYKLHESGFSVEGIDISTEMITLAKERLQGKNIPVSQGDVNDIRADDESYEGALAINVLEWVSNPSKSVKELHRVLRKEGLLCAAVLGPAAGPRAYGYRRVYGEEAILNTMMPWEFLQLAEENGFTLIDHYGVYRKEVDAKNTHNLPLKLKQSLAFMWVFMLKKVNRK